LHVAAQYASPEGVELLLSHGASVDAVTDSDEKRLDHLAQQGRLFGTHDHRRGMGWTPLYYAVSRLRLRSYEEASKQETEVILRLLRAGADPDRPDAGGQTPAQNASAMGYDIKATAKRLKGEASGDGR